MQAGNSRRHRFGLGTSLSAVLASLIVGTFAGDVAADLINVDLRVPSGSLFTVGQTVPVEIWFVSSTSPDTDWTSADLILGWDSNLVYKSFTDEPIVNLTSSTSPKQPSEDGIVWSGVGVNLGELFTADDAPGTHVTTLNLTAKAAGPATISVLLDDQGATTTVYDANFDAATGKRGSTDVTIQSPEPVTAILLGAGLLFAPVRRRFA